MKTIKLITFCLLIPGFAYAQKVELNDVYPSEIASKGFTLSQDASVKITGTSGYFRDEWRGVVFYGWILNAETREVVWHYLDHEDDLSRRDSRDRRNKEELLDYSVDVDLKKGNYELYYTGAYTNNSNDNYNVSVNGLNDLIDQVFDSRSKRKFRSSMKDDLFIAVESSRLSSAEIGDFIAAKSKDAIVSFIRMGEDEKEEHRFNLTAETQLKIYAVGEVQRREKFDYIWIQDAASRERVFEMDYRNSDYAGGAEKNRKLNETITLPAGSYILRYNSDASHSYREWNAMPPDDPEFWGVTMWAASNADKSNFAAFVKPKIASPLLEITGVRDDELLSKGMKVSKEIEVRVLCLGEESSNRMADYGWIVDAKTREKVWEMNDFRTDHAGGAEKNRMTDEKITLPAGDYIVYYTTDDSHAYRDWNAAKPYEEELWGISIWAIKESDMGVISEFNPKDYKNENVIVELTMVGNDEELRETFELDAETKLKVTGVGEGSDGDMDDYGYIKNMDTGRIVWEMRYRNSDHAGGARKNREFNETITLEKGKYRVYFESDGSHAYGRWNADPPSNPELWGISILKN